MAQDETEFDKLLRETREWEARDRQRHKSAGMTDDGTPAEFPRPAAPKAPTVTVEDIVGKSPKPSMSPRSPRPAATAQAPQGGPSMAEFKAAFKAAAKATEAQRAAGRGKGSPWGWIWAIIILFFIIRHFAR